MRTYYDALGMGKVRNHLIISCRCYEEVCRPLSDVLRIDVLGPYFTNFSGLRYL